MLDMEAGPAAAPVFCNVESLNACCWRRRSHRPRGMLDMEPGPAAAPLPYDLKTLNPCCRHRRSHRLRGMLDMEPGPAAAPAHDVAGASDMAAAAAAAAGAQLWELALLRRHESHAVAKAAADLSSIPVDGESSLVRMYRGIARQCWHAIRTLTLWHSQPY